MDKIEIFVATTKKIDFEIPNNCKVVQVNSANNEKIDADYYDDNGENISRKNPHYCELTALYWGWKNSDADIKGLCHYRRFFTKFEKPWYRQFLYVSEKDLMRYAIKDHQIKSILQSYDVIMQVPHLPYPKNAYDDLQNACFMKDIQIMRYVIKNSFPEYYDSLKWAFNKKNLSYFNMMIAKKDVYDHYCEWLFDVLNQIEEKVDMTGYNVQRQRLYGYLAEVLLNVYVKKHNLKVKHMEMMVVQSQWEGTKLWHSKVISFLIDVKLSGMLGLYYKLFKKEYYKSYLACKKNC